MQNQSNMKKENSLLKFILFWNIIILLVINELHSIRILDPF